MPSLPTRSLSAIVSNIAVGVQGRAKALIDFSIGSTLRAIAEGFGSTVLWLQGMILKVLANTRASTSSGTDLDSWVADFGLSRLAAVPATGLISFSRITAGISAPFIPVGATVKTSDGLLSFAVIPDSTNSNFVADLNGYTMPSGISSIDVPVQCSTPGASGNVVAGAITLMSSPVTGVDNAVNNSALVNGSEAESDAALRNRFIAFIASLSKATNIAITYAINSLKLGLQCTIIENKTPDNVDKPGYIWVTVDDGSGNPGDDIISKAMDAVGKTRACGIMWGVFKPTIVRVTMQVSIITAPGYDHNTAVGAVYTALSNFINSTPLGQSLMFSQMIVVASQAYPGITSVYINVLNGAPDTIITPNQVIKTQAVTVT